VSYTKTVKIANMSDISVRSPFKSLSQELNTTSNDTRLSAGQQSVMYSLSKRHDTALVDSQALRQEQSTKRLSKRDKLRYNELVKQAKNAYSNKHYTLALSLYEQAYTLHSASMKLQQKIAKLKVCLS
jgi:hypothetical protein